MNTKSQAWYMKLHWQIAIGMVLGVCLGMLLRSFGEPPEFVIGALDMGGTIFIKLLKMVVLPLVIASVLLGITGIGNTKDLSKLGGRTLFYYMCTSLVSISVGLVFVNLIQPGKRVSLDLNSMEKPKINTEDNTLSDILVRMIPENPFGAIGAVPFEMLSVLFFVIVFGIFALQVSQETRKPIVDLAHAVNEIMIKMVHGVLSLAGIGVFCLVAELVVETGLSVFVSLAWYLLTVMFALGFHFFVILPTVYYIFRRENPFDYMSQMSPALLTAFSSASSAGTLSLTMECSQKNGRVSPKVSSIVLPLGATINMDGTALYEGVAVLFIAQVLGIDLTLGAQFLVLLTALLASVGAAGIPHAGLTTMIIIMETIGLPLEAQSLILAVDRVVDMARTSTNVWSDSIGAAIIEKASRES